MQDRKNNGKRKQSSRVFFSLLFHAIETPLSLDELALVHAPSLQAYKKSKFSNPHLSDLGQRHLHAPELAFVAQAKLSDELELGVEALLLEGTARLLEGLADCAVSRVSRGRQGEREGIVSRFRRAATATAAESKLPSTSILRRPIPRLRSTATARFFAAGQARGRARRPRVARENAERGGVPRAGRGRWRSERGKVDDRSSRSFLRSLLAPSPCSPLFVVFKILSLKGDLFFLCFAHMKIKNKKNGVKLLFLKPHQKNQFFFSLSLF